MRYFKCTDGCRPSVVIAANSARTAAFRYAREVLHPQAITLPIAGNAQAFEAFWPERAQGPLSVRRITVAPTRRGDNA